MDFEISLKKGEVAFGDREAISAPIFLFLVLRSQFFSYCRANVCNFKILKSRKIFAIFGPVAAILDF